VRLIVSRLLLPMPAAHPSSADGVDSTVPNTNVIPDDGLR